MMTGSNARRPNLSRPFLLAALFAVVLVLLPVREAQTFARAPENNPFYYLSPRPGANYVSPGAVILLRSDAFDIADQLPGSAFTIEGTISVAHAGAVELGGDGRTLIFRPHTPFTPGESVQVTITLPNSAARGDQPGEFTFAFSVTEPAIVVPQTADIAEIQQPLDASEPQTALDEPIPGFNYLTAPPDLPPLAVERHPGQLGEGYIFVSTYHRKQEGFPAYLLILDNNGEPVFIAQPLDLPLINDFKKQSDDLLTYFAPGPNLNKFFGLDQNYNVVQEFKAANGYPTDLHDLQLLENGHTLMLAYDPRIVDMSGIIEGGSTEARVIGCVIQELDKDNRLVFQWRSWDYIDILDTNQPLDSVPLSYLHCNSVELDLDGHLLLSSRHLDEVTKINRQTAEIIWRLGGRHNEFDFSNDYGFNYQHDARRLANGNLTLYDNGVAHNPRHSRGLEYRIDETNKIVEKVAEYRNTPEVEAIAMGNMQTLPNGNKIIGWGRSSAPVMTEFDREGHKLLEISSKHPIVSYRAFRFPWQGHPTWPPVLVVRMEEDIAHLHFSWNGSTETASYKIFAGPRPKRLSYVNTVSRDGFETTYAYRVPRDGFHYFQVIPIDNKSTELTPSNIAHAVRGGKNAHMAVIAAP